VRNVAELSEEDQLTPLLVGVADEGECEGGSHRNSISSWWIAAGRFPCEILTLLSVCRDYLTTLCLWQYISAAYRSTIFRVAPPPISLQIAEREYLAEAATDAMLVGSDRVSVVVLIAAEVH
jgi:hypothetical protein